MKNIRGMRVVVASSRTDIITRFPSFYRGQLSREAFNPHDGARMREDNDGHNQLPGAATF